MSRMEMTYCSVSSAQPHAAEILQVLKDTGATSIQTYVYWNKVETQRGKLDWSELDRDLELFIKHGLKWVPFIITGPWYVTPEFIRQDPRLTFYRCLEHDRDSKIPSLWCPVFRSYFQEYLQKFAEHYDASLLESINCGITGDYGEAIYPVMGNWPGEYHTHQGFWCGDSLAQASFRDYANELVDGNIELLNARWHTAYTSFSQVSVQPPWGLSRRRRADFVAWYRHEMTEYARLWLRFLKKLLPSTELYLCTGGLMHPEHGSDFAAQAKVAKEEDCGVRITNEASDYPFNNAITRLVSSASRFYGCFYGNEPASKVTDVGTLGRLYNAVTGGARQLFLYMNAHTQTADTMKMSRAGELLAAHQDFLEQTEPLVETALLFPTTQTALEGAENCYRIAAAIREYLDFDFVDELMIADGALTGFKLLLVAQVEVLEAETLRLIEEFVEKGGVLIMLGSLPDSPDETESWFREFIGIGPEADLAVGHTSAGWVDKSLPSFENTDLVITQAWKGISQVEPLIKSSYDQELLSAWRLKRGDGFVYCYFGPMVIAADPTDWKNQRPYPIMFFRDLVEALIEEGVLLALPVSFNTAKGIYLSNTTQGLLALNLNQEGKAVQINRKQRQLPPLSITRWD